MADGGGLKQNVTGSVSRGGVRWPSPPGRAGVAGWQQLSADPVGWRRASARRPGPELLGIEYYPDVLDPVACEVEGHHRHDDAVLLSDEARLAVYRALQDCQTGCPAGEIGGGAGDLLAALKQLEHGADQAAAIGDRGGAGVEQADEGADVPGFPGLLEVPD